VSDERPGSGSGDGRLQILRQSTTPTEPCKSSFDDPSARWNLDALRRAGTFGDFYRPGGDTLQRRAQFLAGMAAIGKDMAQLKIVRAYRSKIARSAAAILNAGFVHDELDQTALAVGEPAP
jgi:hypothetical protein